MKRYVIGINNEKDVNVTAIGKDDVLAQFEADDLVTFIELWPNIGEKYRNHVFFIKDTIINKVIALGVVDPDNTDVFIYSDTLKIDLDKIGDAIGIRMKSENEVFAYAAKVIDDLYRDNRNYTKEQIKRINVLKEICDAISCAQNQYEVLGHDKDGGYYVSQYVTTNYKDAINRAYELSVKCDLDLLINPETGDPYDWIEVVDAKNWDKVYWVSYAHRGRKFTTEMQETYNDVLINYLVDKISSDSVQNIENFLGYPISADVLENLDDNIREVLLQMPEEELMAYHADYSNNQ